MRNSVRLLEEFLQKHGKITLEMEWDGKFFWCTNLENGDRQGCNMDFELAINGIIDRASGGVISHDV